MDLILQDKDAEIVEWRQQLAALKAQTPVPPLSQRKPDSPKYKSPRDATKPEELLIQLAGHLRGKALMEWNLLEPDDKASS